MIGGYARVSAAQRNPDRQLDIALAQQLYDAGDRTGQQITHLFGVPRYTIDGRLNRAAAGTPA